MSNLKSTLKWSRKDNFDAVHLGFNVFDCDDGSVRIQCIDDYGAWRPLGCECDSVPLLDRTVRDVRPKLQACSSCARAGFKTNWLDDDLTEPVFADDESAVEWVLRNARKNKTCRKAVKLAYGI